MLAITFHDRHAPWYRALRCHEAEVPSPLSDIAIVRTTGCRSDARGVPGLPAFGALPTRTRAPVRLASRGTSLPGPMPWGGALSSRPARPIRPSCAPRTYGRSPRFGRRPDAQKRPAVPATGRPEPKGCGPRQGRTRERTGWSSHPLRVVHPEPHFAHAATCAQRQGIARRPSGPIDTTAV